MDTASLVTKLQGAIDHQVVVAGGDPDVEAAARALMAALEPVVRQLAFDLAEQAADEVSAQLPGHDVDVVLAGGEPALRVRAAEGAEPTSSGESLDARITFRLPPTLKELIEYAADERGESVNSWLVKTVSVQADGSRRGRSRRMTGSIET
ncbi:MAG TPA: hypothetical protein VMM81_04970 [Acidimicrobiia bacterium]|nr:hypothetical protein [Acidimicrobiia bacterium]